MTRLPSPTAPTLINLIDAAHESLQGPPRHHLGASLLGHHCDRWLWLSFRWAVQEPFHGRVLRLFRRGQNEEAPVVDDLRAAGLMIVNAGDDQKRVDFGSHVSGSLDGIILEGVPTATGKKHVLEIKTHSEKSFKDLCKQGVKISKPMHWAQMQVYMLGTEIDRALYVGVNKNDDHLYTERVRLDKPSAQAFVDRGHRIAQVDRMPEPCQGAAPDWYLCKWCPAHDFCHGSKTTKEVNCRTCAHSTATPDSAWTCKHWGAIPADAQLAGCAKHVLHPDLVPWQLDSGASTEHVATWIIEGQPVQNGESSADVFFSTELISNLQACIDRDPGLMLLRARFDGEIVG